MVAREGTTTIVAVVDGETEVARWRLGCRSDDLATVDALARLALAARRRGWTVRLRRPGAELRELLALVGIGGLFADDGPLPGELGRQAEEAEELGAEEMVVPGDSPP